VGDEQARSGEPFQMLGQRPSELDPSGDVESGQRLVQQQQVRLGGQRSSQGHPLCLAA
jgi:hypothetical protein